jgi:hypothetical protein
MKKTILTIVFISILACKNNLDNWIIYKDSYNIGSISLPENPNVNIDTIVTPKFKLVSSIHIASLKDRSTSPSAFSYDIYFPTDNNEFDLFQKKQDSITLDRLFEGMIKGAQNKSGCEVKEKTYFKFPEPGVKVTLINLETKRMGVCRIIIFDNYVIATTANGSIDSYSYEMEDKFFNSLNINPEKRNRK